MAYHRISRRLAELEVPAAVRRRGEEMLAGITNPLSVGDTDVVEGWHIETHTIGCRNAADELEEDWWDSHWAIYEEYAADGRIVVDGDPTDGIFITYMRSGSA